MESPAKRQLAFQSGELIPANLVPMKAGKIAGFARIIPEDRPIDAVLEGPAIAIAGDADDAQMDDILAGRAVRLDAQPYRLPRAEPKPDIPPSYEVHISPTETRGTSSVGGSDYWVQRGSIWGKCFRWYTRKTRAALYCLRLWTTANDTISSWFCRAKKINRLSIVSCNRALRGSSTFQLRSKINPWT